MQRGAGRIEIDEPGCSAAICTSRSLRKPVRRLLDPHVTALRAPTYDELTRITEPLMHTPHTTTSLSIAARLRLQWLCACAALLAAFAFMPVAHAQNGSSDQPVVQRLLDTMAQNDYQGFIAQGTPEFGALGEPEFAKVANALSPRLKQGYDVTYLGSLRQQGLDISVWKISFADKGDDLLATLNVREGKVGGFFLR